MLLSGYCTNLNGDIMKKIIFEILCLIGLFVCGTVYIYYNSPNPYNMVESCIASATILAVVYSIIKLSEFISKKKKNKNQNKDNEE